MKFKEYILMDNDCWCELGPESIGTVNDIRAVDYNCFIAYERLRNQLKICLELWPPRGTESRYKDWCAETEKLIGMR